MPPALYIIPMSQDCRKICRENVTRFVARMSQDYHIKTIDYKIMIKKPQRID